MYEGLGHASCPIGMALPSVTKLGTLSVGRGQPTVCPAWFVWMSHSPTVVQMHFGVSHDSCDSYWP